MIVLSGCSAQPNDDAADPTGASQAPIEIEEELATVDVTIARSLLDPNDSMTDEAIVAAAQEEGLTATVSGDAVIYTMTKTQRDERLAQMRSSAQQAIDEMVADTSNSVTGVEFNDAMTAFQVAVDGDQFAPMEAFLALAFYVQGALYQQFAGVPVDDIDVTVNFVDDVTGEVLQTGSYQEMRKNASQ
ncbi:hypothetical protein [Naasia sp. SYSU D00948]|uniref:hypothetical protein n=1 Tax=Naasia sp. SYSU D00948 TaxID=2817379 RepID=UPI001B30CA6C|nr:hypothetical protein [Naasia sp. SYSU D00948]